MPDMSCDAGMMVCKGLYVWCPGQVHVPLLTNGTDLEEFDDSHLSYQGQTFFNDTFLDSVYTTAPYTSNAMGARTVLVRSIPPTQ